MILSDRTIRESIASGRIVIEPLDEKAIQPSSVDLRLGRYFRVFLNHTMPVIDVKQDLSELTREVEIADGEAFILHPGRSCSGRRTSASDCRTISSRESKASRASGGSVC